MPDVLMPRLSDSMQEGTILRWLKHDGDDVAAGDGLAQIGTDTATTTYAAETAGVLRLVASEGDTLAVGEVIASLGAEDRAAGSAEVVERGTAKGDVRREELSRAQQVVARRVAESKATIPDFTIRTVVDMDAAVAALEALAGRAGEAPPSVDDLVVKACAVALREVPRANAAYRDGRFELYSRVNVGIAVPSGGTLTVPTIFDADRKGLAEIARDARTLAERVRAGVVTPPELSGGTFTVASLGGFGVTEFAAVITPPQAAILAVGSLEQRPVVRDGALVAGHTLTLTLTCDHRILYGAEAASFLARIRALLEAPSALAR